MRPIHITATQKPVNMYGRKIIRNERVINNEKLTREQIERCTGREVDRALPLANVGIFFGVLTFILITSFLIFS